MNQLRISTKPTLDGMLKMVQTQQIIQKNNKKIVFPLINTNLKKLHFTKYHSAFLSVKNLDESLNSKPSLSVSKQRNNTSFFQSQLQSAGQVSPKSKMSMNKKLWKLNKRSHKSQARQSFKTSIQLHSPASQILLKQDIEDPQKYLLLTQAKTCSLPTESISVRLKSKQQINEEINLGINRVNKMISLIKKNCSNLTKNTRSKSNNEQLSFQKLEEKVGLFSYLKRNFITNHSKLTPQKIKQYFKTPSSQKLQAKINFQSRLFLQDKLQNDYHSHQEVQNLKKELSEKAIQQEIQFKKQQFHDEYKKKYNNPYMSFLCLPKKLKAKVLQNLSKTDQKQIKSK